MGKATIILGIVVFIWVAIAGYQIGSCEVANHELHEDMVDIATQNAAKIGLSAPNTDEDIRNSVIRSAKEHGIELEPKQVMVQRNGPADAPVFYLTANYTVRLNLPGYSASFHFTPTSTW